MTNKKELHSNFLNIIKTILHISKSLSIMHGLNWFRLVIRIYLVSSLNQYTIFLLVILIFICVFAFLKYIIIIFTGSGIVIIILKL